MKHADILDRANEVAEEWTNEQINGHRWAARPEQVQGADGKWETLDCVDCGELIEDARLLMGKVRCYSCQELKERRYGLVHR